VDERSSDPIHRFAMARFVCPAGLVGALLTAFVLTISAAAPERAESTLPSAAAARLQALPLAARSLVSRTLGRDQASYRIHRAAAGLAAENRAHGLEVRFLAGG
jgi:hypothetical protein